MAMLEIKRIKPMSLAKVMALIYGLVGFIMTLIVAALVAGNLIGQKDLAGSALLITLFNVGAGLLLGVLAAVLTAALGWLVGLTAAVIYNWLAKKVGGVKIELRDAEEVRQKPGHDFNNN